MKSGDYEAATEWMEVGRAFEAFSKKIVVIRGEWQELVTSSQQTLEKAEGAAADARSKPRHLRIRASHLYVPALTALVKTRRRSFVGRRYQRPSSAPATPQKTHADYVQLGF